MSYATIRTKLRNILNDNSISGKDIFTFDSSKVFSLSEDRVIAISDVLKNSVSVSESGNWSYSASTNKLTFTSGYSLSVGDIIELDYSYYKDFSDTELTGYINGALSWITVSNYETFDVNDDDINPEPTTAEENLIAIIASIIIRPDNKNYKMQDLEVRVPNNSLPTEEKIRRVIASFKRNTHGVFSVIITQ